MLDAIELAALGLGERALEQMMTVHEAEARRARTPEDSAEHLVRSARFMLAFAKDARDAAFRHLDEALAKAPHEERLYDAIEEVAATGGLVERLDARLARVVEETMSDEIAAVFLRRRARLLHHRRGLPSEAADAYLRLWALRPHDSDTFRHLRVCLLETGRIHELISAAERELARLQDDRARVSLMREVARLWEEEVKNPWEAKDAWKRVLRAAPDDATAKEAVARLETRAKG